MNSDDTAQNTTSEPAVPPTPPSIPEDVPKPIILNTKAPEPPVPENPKKSFSIAVFMIPLVVILGLLLGSTLFVVYAKVPLIPFGLKAAVSSVVLKIPFLPKTPEYVMITAANVNKDIRSAEVDASLSLSSQAISEFIDTNDLDLAINGAFDFNDKENPLSEFNVDYKDYFNFDLINVSKSSYFKVNKVDPAIFTVFPYLENADVTSLTNVWVETEKTVTTSAKEKLEKEKVEQQLGGFTTEDLIAFLEEDVVPNVQMTKETSESTKIYRLKLDIDQELLQKFIARTESKGITGFQDMISNLKIESGQLEVVINSDTYYIEQTSVTLVFAPDIPVIGTIDPTSTDNVLGESVSSQVRITATVRFSNQKAPVTLQKPAQSISISDYIDNFMEIYINLLNELSTGKLLDTEGSSLVGPPKTGVGSGMLDTPFGRLLQ